MKRILAVPFAAIVALFLFGQFHKPSAAELIARAPHGETWMSRSPRQFQSIAEEQNFVNTWYASTNETYFNNELPKDTKIVIADIPEDKDGFTIADTTPLGNGQYLIRIDPRFNNAGNTDGPAIDHEMCHIYLDQESGDGDRNHGPRFQACMHRRAQAGTFKELR
jgi:SprT-like family